MSLLCRLKNLVHKGVLKEKDLERIVIIPKGQEPCEDCISRAEALKNLTLTNNKDDVYRMINSLSSVQPKTDVLDKIKAVAIKWKTDTWTDYLSYECMCEIADILAESEENKQ